ncbi:9429_t:CDS:10 [Paraglomus occultum]|uniref:Probable valine--tRNA ligase, cytoplasmic n=1 Tax=Paraglomus occultum TaxID=144539 RepID=A0A9N8ZZC7_9GLOM|nr:9429_t:CDS:10 [Paraglomus occultum]
MADAPAPDPVKEEKKKRAEQKKLEKLEKFRAKQEKLAQVAAASKKDKPKKVKAINTDAPIDKTPIGEKKILISPEMPEMPSVYNPAYVESSWYAWWEKEGFFKPVLTPDGKPKPEGLFVVPSPPPNVTGSLHIGHALTIAIQDTLVRWNRMLGKTVLFIPGTDHAGISTQSVVEKKLWVDKQLTRHDLGREDFVAQIWKWKELYGDRIHMQMKRLGASYDWDRAVFTMDPMMCKAVNENFCRLHEQGLIYRATRMVNWCVRLNTALSNLEVDYERLSNRTFLKVPGYEEKVEFGVMYNFAYPIEGSDERIVVATTRPETMLGDTAIAVHPQDTRFTKFHGKSAVHPFNGRKLPIILDDSVNMETGTGAVKITPAHDFNDYGTGKRHNLEFINIFNDNGTLNANGSPFEGKRRFDVRKEIIEELKKLGLYEGDKNHPMDIPFCSRSKDVIEPLLKPQWWVNCKGMAQDAIDAVRSGSITIRPSTSKDEWFRWLENIRDWCISRQLWWGHRIPAYFVKIEGLNQDKADEEFWVSGRTLEEAQQKAEKKFSGKKFSLEQDQDVLDTWFSSGLWPFAILGWPDKTDDFANFYPTNLLETGWDIIFFWVARMVMLGIKHTGTVPFNEVFCHPIIRDAQGRKMSKTLGNVVDPVDVIDGISLERLHAKLREGNLDKDEIERAQVGQKENFPDGIPQCGTDALRFTLCNYTTTSARNINLNVNVLFSDRTFCNKLWQATRFALKRLGDDFVPQPTEQRTNKETIGDRWILHRLNDTVTKVNEGLHNRNFKSVTDIARGFCYYDLCDVYLEWIKPITSDQADAERKRSSQDTLYTALEATLKMLHPFMPYITEELYQRLPRRPGDTIPTISLAKYPLANKDYIDTEAEELINLALEAVKAARTIVKDNYEGQKNKYELYIRDDKGLRVFAEDGDSIGSLVGIKTVKILNESETLPDGIETLKTDHGIDVAIKKL